jgi:hypothetical protein
MAKAGNYIPIRPSASKSIYVCDQKSSKIHEYMKETGEVLEYEVDNPNIFQLGFQYFQTP